MSNILKRKNEESKESPTDQLSKRVALDSEQIAASENEIESSHTAPAISVPLPVAEDESSDDEQPPSDVAEVPTAELQSVLDSVAPQLAPEIPSHPATVDPVPHSAPATTSPPLPEDAKSKPVHREKEDPTYVSFRMYCPVKEAGIIVGKKGEKINHIREKANVSINVSENLRNMPERIVSVRGPAENVAKAFGLIARTILDEPEDEPASYSSKQYQLKLLIPHPMVGYIIGKLGAKFREIEENSAAKLKAAETPLPYSTDRVLTVSGVGDAIHIAVYYISQVVIEHKDCLKKNKVIYYNPVNYRPPMENNMMMPTNMMMMNNPVPMHTIPPKDPYQAKPYNFQMMFQPAIPPQHLPYMPQPVQHAPPMQPFPPQQAYTDEHGNNIVGDVITHPPIPVQGSTDRFDQDVFVANTSIGLVIGKGGHNIKQIRENSGCSYVKIEPDQGQQIMLGGRGLTSIRKLTLTGNLQSIQTAIFLINQRISTDKERNR